MTSATQTAWLAAGSVLTIGAFGWGALNIVDLLAHEVRTVTEVVDAEGVAVIDIDNTNGRVIVTGTETDEITIVARISDGLRATGNSSRVVGDRLEIRDVPVVREHVVRGRLSDRGSCRHRPRHQRRRRPRRGRRRERRGRRSTTTTVRSTSVAPTGRSGRPPTTAASTQPVSARRRSRSTATTARSRS